MVFTDCYMLDCFVFVSGDFFKDSIYDIHYNALLHTKSTRRIILSQCTMSVLKRQ